MKIRSNYVSNSSSTSYIIEFDDIDKIVTIIGEEFSIADFFEAITSNMYDSETKMHECTYEDTEDAAVDETSPEDASSEQIRAHVEEVQKQISKVPL